MIPNMPAPPAPLTLQDAQTLIQLVQSAPLANLQHARQVDQLRLRAQVHFTAFFNEQLGQKEKPVEERVKKIKRSEAPEAANDPTK